MRRKPKPAKAAAQPAGRLQPGGLMMPVPPPRRKPPPKPAAATGGGGWQQPPPPGPVPPGGGGWQKPPVARKPPARRKLAAPGESCVLDACHALAGCSPDLDYGDGLFIPDALEALVRLGLITGYAPADLDADLTSYGLVLGVDLPGPHAVLTVPDGWHSWGDVYDPADFPQAVIEEAWAVW